MEQCTTVRDGTCQVSAVIPGVITIKITTNLPIGRIAIYPHKAIYYSPLGLIPKAYILRVLGLIPYYKRLKTK